MRVLLFYLIALAARRAGWPLVGRLDLQTFLRALRDTARKTCIKTCIKTRIKTRMEAKQR